jgi:hypothetical protein
MSEWISIDERLPNDGDTVIGARAYGLGGVVDAAICDFEGGKFTANSDALDATNYGGNASITLYVKLTHWCEMPELKQ